MKLVPWPDPTQEPRRSTYKTTLKEHALNPQIELSERAPDPKLQFQIDQEMLMMSRSQQEKRTRVLETKIFR